MTFLLSKLILSSVTIIAITGVSGFNLKMTANAPQLRAVLWDVDGTLADSYMLGYASTNTVFRNNGLPEIGEDVYHMGTKYTTPRRLAGIASGAEPAAAEAVTLARSKESMVRAKPKKKASSTERATVSALLKPLAVPITIPSTSPMAQPVRQ